MCFRGDVGYAGCTLPNCRGYLQRSGLLRVARPYREAGDARGRLCLCKRAESAWALHRAWPESKLIMVPDAGHSAHETGITRALVDATDRFAR